MFRGYEETWGRALARRADRICVVSDAHARTVDYLRATARREPSKLAEIPNGVDLEHFAPVPGDEGNPRAALGIPADAVVAAFVATLDRAHWSKRCDLAIEALARAGDERLHLLVVGGGEWLERHRAEARAAGVAERVHFAGAQPHEALPRYLRAADLLLLTSDLESFGIVLLEAMACGLPTAATDPPGVRAVVREGETGLLAPRGDAPALAARLRELVAAGEDGRAAMGAAGRALCVARYGWAAIGDRLELVYEAAMSRAGRRAGVFEDQRRMTLPTVPRIEAVGNAIAGEQRPATSGATFEKLAPATGEVLSRVARSDRATSTPPWPPRRRRSRRGRRDRRRARRVLRRIAQLLERDAERGRRGRGRRDRQVARRGARRDRRRDRDGLLRRGRGPALLRPHHHQRACRTARR